MMITVEFGDLGIDGTLFGVRILNGWIIVRDEMRLNELDGQSALA